MRLRHGETLQVQRQRLWMVNQYAIGPDQPGGTRHYGLAKELQRHEIETLIIASPLSYMTRAGHGKGSTSPQTHAGVTFLWLAAPGYSGNSLARILNMLVFALKAVFVPLVRVARGRLDRPHMVLGSSPSMFAAAAGMVLARLLQVPFILEVRDVHPKSIVAMGIANRWHPYVVFLSLLERVLYCRADLIVSPLQGVGAHVQRTIGRDKPWVWVPNYINIDSMPEPSPARIDPHPFRVVYTGAHGLPNSLDTLLDAAKLLKDEDVEFWLYGEGVMKEQLKAKASTLRLANVHFEAPVPKARVTSLLQEADVLVLPVRDSRLYDDGFSPNKLYDYLASGRPIVIATDTPYNPVRQAAAGVTVPPEQPAPLAEAIQLIRRLTATEREGLGQRARNHASTVYDVKIVASRLAGCLLALQAVPYDKT